MTFKSRYKHILLFKYGDKILKNSPNECSVVVVATFFSPLVMTRYALYKSCTRVVAQVMLYKSWSLAKLSWCVLNHSQLSHRDS